MTTIKKREWIRSFEIGSPFLPTKSKQIMFTVTSLIFPAGFPEASTKLELNKKYSDFQKLQKSLSDIHKNLYLKGNFPTLPKASTGYFNKSTETPESGEEKRVQCLQLLEFCSQHPQLCNSKIFTDFFSDVESPKSETEIEDVTERLLNDGSNRHTDVIHRLSKEGNILEAAALSADLAPDPTPSLAPNTSKLGDQDDRKISSSDPIHQTETDGNASSTQQNSDDIPEYLSDAANFISMALQYENDENFEESVNCYRNAIGTLLQSVQKDSCLQRQASVKRRIAQYITKAESLIQLDNANKSASASPRKSTNRIPHLELFGNIRDLRSFKIKSILSEKVLLVTEAKSGNLVVIKALQKSSLVFKQRKTSMLPVNISFMVRLLRYFETDDMIYLVLEFVSYGPLLPIVRPYLERQNADETSLADASLRRELSPFSTSSVIKPSPSFVKLRRRSIQPPTDAERSGRPRSTSLELGPTSKVEDVAASSNDYFRSSSISSVEDFNFVFTNHDADDDELICVDQEKIEIIRSNSGNGANNADEGEKISTEPLHLTDSETVSNCLLKSQGPTISIHAPSNNSDSEQLEIDSSKLVESSKSLLNSVTAQLVSLKESKSAETILLEVEDIEKHIHLHLDGRALTPTSCVSSKAASESPVSPPSTSSLTSSPPPVYADNELENDGKNTITQSKTAATSITVLISDLVLSDLCSTFDGVDLTSSDAILPMELIRRWSAQLCHVVMSLHSRGVVIQDLHPGNLLLGNDLHLRLTYQCEWVSVDKSVNWKAIEMLYCAPEVSDVAPLTQACDWWSVGAILYELLTGHRLIDVHPSGLLAHTPLCFPESRRLAPKEKVLEAEMKSLVASLLQPLAFQRLGAGSAGHNNIKSHPFFKQINWSLT